MVGGREHDVAVDRARVGELRASPLFRELDDAALEAIADRTRRRLVAAGEQLIAAGEVADRLYLVVRGRLQVYTTGPDGRERILNEAGPGDVVGELGLLSDRPRLASVRTVRDSELLELSAADFRTTVEQAPSVALHVARTVISHLERSARPVEARVRSIAVLPAGSTAPPVVRAVAEQLCAALGPETHRIDEDVLRDRLGEQPSPAEVVELFDRCESDPADVVYVADGTSAAWTERCARQADRILLVGDARARPAPNPSEGIGPRHTRRHLVLVQPASTRVPAGTARWLDSRPELHGHHHVRQGSAEDMERVARLLTGRATALVLGGGGPRGFAHLGVIRALEERGIPIDMIGGTSIGALMAAGKAFGWDHETRVENAIRTLAGTNDLFRPTLPLVALTSGRAVTRLLRDPGYLGETSMEDFWLRWFCVSTNLTKARPVVHERGPAWLWIRCSVGLPGILPPVFSHGDLLVDGGVLNNLPVDVMRERMEGRVIAVDLEPEVDLRLRQPFPPALSGWRVVAERFRRNGRALDVPNAIQVIMRAKQVGGEHAQRAVLTSTPVDLLIRPPMESFGALNFGAGAALVESAHQHTLAQLDESGFS